MTNYTLVPRADFLSGNVRARHKQLQAVAKVDSRFARERDALENVIPADIPLSQVEIRLGATWIPIEDLESFLWETLDFSMSIIYSETTSTWSVEAHGNQNTMENKQQYGLQWETYERYKNRDGIFDYHKKSKELTGLKLIEMALNMSKPKIKVRREANSPKEVSLLLTAQAQSKQDALQARFSEWCREDEHRSARLERIYNDRFNSLRKYKKGQNCYSEYGPLLTLPGMSAEWRDRIFARPFQREGIAQGMIIGGGIFFEVGLGKTPTIIAIARERKRIGNCRKPLIIVKKSTLSQFSRTIQQMYPDAKVLTAQEKDLSINNRQVFMCRAASTDWDFIVMTHEQFGSIPMRNGFTIKFYQNEIDKIEREKAAINEANRNASRSSAVKAMERRGRSLLKKLEHLEAKKDAGLCWEDLGVDFLAADEYDCFKNLAYLTKLTDVIGLGPTKGSDRALDFEMKRSYSVARYSPNRLLGATGTPIANTMGEMWKVMMDFAPEAMAERGWSSFDAWLAANCKIVEQPEITQAGGIKTRQRLCEFINMPEMLTLFFSFAMVVRADDSGIERPAVKQRTIAAKMSPWQEQFSNDLIDRATEIEAAMGDDSKQPRKWCPLKWYDKRDYDKLRTESDDYWRCPIEDLESYDVWPQDYLQMMDDKRLPSIDLADWRRDNDQITTKNYLRCGPQAAIDPEDEEGDGELYTYKLAIDNMLRISTEGRKCSLDGRLVHWRIIDDPRNVAAWKYLDFDGSKINLCARQVAGIYRHTRKVKATQAVFLDLSTPKGDRFSVYLMLKREMMRRGVPEDQIAFIHDYDNDAKRLLLFDKMNRGDIAVLLGSTEKMGVGVNIQERLIAMHHVDCPWRPRDLEQRRGRGQRPGNMFKRMIWEFFYVTQGSSGGTGFDSFMWQGVEAKLRFLLEILTGDTEARHMTEDASDSPIFTAAQIKALATGDTRIMEYVGIENDLRRCQSLIQGAQSAVHLFKHGTNDKSIKTMERDIKRKYEILDQIDEIIPTISEWRPICTGEAFHAEIINPETNEFEPVEGHKEVGKAIWKYIEGVVEKDTAEYCNRLLDIGQYGGLRLRLQVNHRQGYNSKGEESIQISRQLYLLAPWENIELACIRDPLKVGERIEHYWVGIFDKYDRINDQIRQQQANIDKTKAELARREQEVITQSARRDELNIRKMELEIELGIAAHAESTTTISIGDDDQDW